MNPIDLDLSKYRNGDQVARRLERRGRPCRHLGDRVSAVEVPGCCGTSMRVQVFACAVHQRCSPEVELDADAAADAGVPPFRGCRECPEWVPGANLSS